MRHGVHPRAVRLHRLEGILPGAGEGTPRALVSDVHFYTHVALLKMFQQLRVLRKVSRDP